MRTIALLLLAAPPAFTFRLPTPISPRATSGTSALTQLGNSFIATLAAAAVLNAVDAPAAAFAEPASFSDASAVGSATAGKTDLSIAVKKGAISIPQKKLPKSVGVTLPVLGSLKADIDIRVNKVTADEVAQADVVVSLPSDLSKAAKLAGGGGAGVVLDAPGLVSGRVDLGLSQPSSGETDITITSPLIPKLPLLSSKGFGRFCYDCGNGEDLSEWFVVRNLKNGVSFYTNARTETSQFNAPGGL